MVDFCVILSNNRIFIKPFGYFGRSNFGSFFSKTEKIFENSYTYRKGYGLIYHFQRKNFLNLSTTISYFKGSFLGYSKFNMYTSISNNGIHILYVKTRHPDVTLSEVNKSLLNQNYNDANTSVSKKLLLS